MPLSIGKVTVDVSLCGAVPRSWSSDNTCTIDRAPPSTPSSKQCQKLSEVTSSRLNSIDDGVLGRSCVANVNGKNQAPLSTPFGRSKITRPFLSSDCVVHQVHDNDQGQNSVSAFSPMPSRSPLQLPMLEPPHWAVPSSAEACLEPVCEAVDSHCKVDLTSRAFFRIGRSPGSDVQLLHSTSSRRHALLFHHPNGSCYIVDCGSST